MKFAKWMKYLRRKGNLSNPQNKLLDLQRLIGERGRGFQRQGGRDQQPVMGFTLGEVIGNWGDTSTMKVQKIPRN